MEKIKNLIVKYKILFTVLVVTLCVLFLFVFYNPLSTKPTPISSPINNDDKDSSILQPIYDSSTPDLNQANLKEDIEKINVAKDKLVSKALGSSIKIPLNFSISEAEKLNKYVNPTAYKTTLYNPTELANVLNNAKTEQISGDTVRFYEIDRISFIKTISNLFIEFSNNNKSGNYTINLVGNEQYISNYLDEYKKSATKDEATHVVYTYQLFVNNLPVLSNKGFIFYIVIENIKTKKSTIDMFNFVPKSAQKIVSYSINSGVYTLSPLVSMDIHFSNFYINNDVTLLANDFDITPGLPVVDYYFDIENNYMIPLVTKTAYLYDDVYKNLSNKGYLLVINE